MKNNQQQILSEIKSLMASIKAQVEELENKIAEYQQSLDSQDIEDDLPVEEMDVVEVQETIETEPVVEQTNTDSAN